MYRAPILRLTAGFFSVRGVAFSPTSLANRFAVGMIS